MPSRWRRVLAAALAGSALLASLTLTAPWWRLRPGPVLDAGPSAGAPSGRIYVLTVIAQDLTWAQAISAMVMGDPLMALPGDGTDARRRVEQQATDSAAHARAAAETLTGTAVTWPDDPGFAGPSAGLAIALAMVDASFDGDLVGGRQVAASASISADGTTGPVGGLPLKLRSAADAGIDVVLVSPGDAISESGLDVIEVDSLAQAVAWLCQLDSSDGACARSASLTR